MVTDPVEKINRLVFELENVCQRKKSRINEGKLKVVRCSNPRLVGIVQSKLNREVEKVKEFQNLESILCASVETEKEANHRLS